MKILQVNAVYGIMSTGRTCLELSDFLWNNGHECITFYGEGPGDGEHAVYMGSTLSHKIHALSARICGDWGIGSWNATSKLLKFINKYSPDVVHLRNLHGNYVHLPMLLSYLAKYAIPVVITLHDFMPMTGGCAHFTTNSCNNWTIGCLKCRHLHRGLDYLLWNRAADVYTSRKKLYTQLPRLGVLGVSEWTATIARRSPLFSNANYISHVYNWINFEIFKPHGKVADSKLRYKLDIGNRKMILGVSSGWGSSKGLDEFCRLAQMLGDEYRIVLVGNIPANIKLPSNILSVGSTDSTQALAAYYSAADVFVHLSLQETFGKVIAEALACGTPAIVFNSTASPELISPMTGIAVNPDDGIRGISASIRTILNAPTFYTADACVAHARTNFNYSRNCSLQLSFYNQLLK